MKGIDLNIRGSDKDFGKGFYVTNDIKQAAKRAGQNGAIVVFKVKELELRSFRGKIFTSADTSWETFVKGYRNGTAIMHSYDYVEGPMLGNLKWPKGKGSPEAWGHQISIHTHRMASWLFRHIVPAVLMPQQFL
jgi:hypothetical protein